MTSATSDPTPADAGEPTRSPLVRPPSLRTSGSRSASTLELFFDLAYVLVVTELARSFLEDLSVGGAATFAGIFVAIWFSWVGFTLYANRFDTDDVAFRLFKLAATLAIAGCAASAADATGSLSWAFAGSYLLGRVLLLALYGRAWRHVPEARGTVSVYLAAITVSGVLWAVSLAVPAPWRYGLWALAVAVDAAGPLVATARDDDVPLHVEHLPERFGLLVILVLGEAVGATAFGLRDDHWSAATVVAAAIGFVVAAGLWWSYFDVSAASSADDLQDDHDEDVDVTDPEQAGVDMRHDLYIYGHLPLTLGIAAAGVGVEWIVTHPDAALLDSAGWVLVGGLALYFAGAALILAGADGRWHAAWPWPSVAVPLVVAAGFVPWAVATWHLVVVAVIAVVTALAGTVSRRSD